MQIPFRFQWKQLLWPVKILVTGGLLVWLVHSFPMGEVFSRIRGMDWGWFFLALLLGQGVWFMQAWRWRQTTLSSDEEMPPLKEFLYHTSVGYFFNLLLPSGMGGDAVKSISLGRAMKDVSGSIASVFMSRVMGITTMLICYWIALFWWDSPLPQAMHLGMGALSLATLVGWVGFLGPWQFSGIQCAWFRRLMDFRNFLKVGGRGWWESILIQILTMAQQWIFFRCVGVPMPWIPVILFIPPITLLTMIPVSLFGIGVREWATVHLFTLAGFSAAECLSASGPAYLLVFIQALGGGLWLAYRSFGLPVR